MSYETDWYAWTLQQDEYLMEAYNVAKPRALDETGLLSVPETCPWRVDEIVNEEFMP